MKVLDTYQEHQPDDHMGDKQTQLAFAALPDFETARAWKSNMKSI
jgi:hypothetical protein